jgi:hypothetical protein
VKRRTLHVVPPAPAPTVDADSPEAQAKLVGEATLAAHAAISKVAEDHQIEPDVCLHFFTIGWLVRNLASFLVEGAKTPEIASEGADRFLDLLTTMLNDGFSDLPGEIALVRTPAPGTETH